MGPVLVARHLLVRQEIWVTVVQGVGISRRALPVLPTQTETAPQASWIEPHNKDRKQ